MALHWKLAWEWGLRQWCLILSLLCCFLSLARWMDPYTGKETAGGETTGSGMQSSFSSARKETSSSYAFRLVTLAQHEYLLHSHWHMFCTLCGVLRHHPTHFGEMPTLWQRTSYITSSWHAVQHLGDDHHSMFNILALVSSMRIIKYISLAEFYVFIVILWLFHFIHTVILWPQVQCHI